MADTEQPEAERAEATQPEADHPEADHPEADHPEAALRRLEWFARWSDDVFQVPGTNVRVGLEPLVGLIPGVGDAAGLIVAAYVPVEAWRLGAPWRMIGWMLLNIALDGVLGTVPIVGDLFDLVYKANRRNVDALVEWVQGEK